MAYLRFISFALFSPPQSFVIAHTLLLSENFVYIVYIYMRLLTPFYPLTLMLLITTIVVFNLFYLPIKSLILGTKCVFKHQDLQRICLKLNKYE